MRTLRRMNRVFRTAATAVAALSIAGGPAFADRHHGHPQPPAPTMPIEHVVVIFQEPISPQARRCDRLCAVITSATICRFTAGRSRFLPVHP